MTETCGTIPSDEADEQKLNLEPIDDECSPTGLVCVQYDEPWVYDGSWSYC